MAYTTPITNRSKFDIDNKTNKAYWNVVDWQRIQDNSLLVGHLLAIKSTSPDVSDLSMYWDAAPNIGEQYVIENLIVVLYNIEKIRSHAHSIGIPCYASPIKYDWVAGINEPSPTYLDANLWEETMHTVWLYYNGPSLPVCPTLTNNLSLTSGTTVYIDCLNAADFNISLTGSANLAII